MCGGPSRIAARFFCPGPSTKMAYLVDVKGGLIGTSPVYEALTQTMGSALVGMVFVEEGVVSQRMI